MSERWETGCGEARPKPHWDTTDIRNASVVFEMGDYVFGYNFYNAIEKYQLIWKKPPAFCIVNPVSCPLEKDVRSFRNVILVRSYSVPVGTLVMRYGVSRRDF